MPAFDFLTVALAAILGCGGILLLWRGITIVVRGRATWWWPVTEGTVVSATLKTWTMLGEVGGPDLVMHIPQVEYDYAIGDLPDSRRNLRGRLVCFGLDHLGYLTKAGAEAHLACYRPGQTVSVVVNPADRSQAVLERGQRGGYFWVFVGSVASLAALALIVGAAVG
ncbi:MAG: DUF3592 domain-containing protein [Xanthobacteraceae bacterium]